MTSWSVHCCLLDAECRSMGLVARVHLNTPWWHIGVALHPSSRFAYLDGSSTWTSRRRWTSDPISGT